MRRKTISLIEDRFLSKKFRHKNQHVLAFWLKDIAPDDEWFLGEMAFKGFKKETLESKLFAFSVYVNQNHNTINVAELDCKGIINDEQLMESVYEGKGILKVFAVKNISENILQDSDKFQSTIHRVLMKYVDDKEDKSAERRYLKKNSE